MIEQNIVQAALLSIETFNGTKSKFEAWKESIENAAQISGQNTICKAFSNLTGSPLSTAIGFKAKSPNLILMEFKRELSMLYSVIPFDIHVTQAFT